MDTINPTSPNDNQRRFVERSVLNILKNFYA
jgi:hypothetical protein